MTAPQTGAARKDAALIEEGRKLFAGEADFIWASPDKNNLMPEGPIEVAFTGRSNVGKSSLINALTGRKALARTSVTPGRTQELVFFDIGGRFRLVDMPGYGYAEAPKEKVAAWTSLIFDYLRGRSTLARVLLLIDARRGPKEVDDQVMDTLDKSAVPYQIVFTKADQISPAALAELTAATQSRVARRPAAFPTIVATSSVKGTGIPELRAAIAQLLKERGA
ncbi:MAG: YihA family ribosome biogenesis GTP-binding protein [Rhizobiales bacterium 65-9]|nr:YihA family ribosome biogenesis GTP-binding protein [Hyphomicrobiales bacterium]OJY38150.1 MAG: YihA family ribosome biogenesis GTP-binding protein [Rhizobiales bacterium 65-9]